ncbi:hypothetical protein JCM8097_007206 [Rhodosporidiobolus ruineniae]
MEASMAPPAALPPLPPPPASLPPLPPAPAAPAQPPPPPPPAPPAHDAALLERQLPVVSQDLVPLSYLIDRTVQQAYTDLATLADTLPSHPDQHRKRLIVDLVLHTRRQLLKLLVLTRWSTEAPNLHKAMNVVAFLGAQDHALEATVAGLTETHQMLAGARVRNYDLPTALTVLTKGTYDALPSAIREAFAGEDKLGDEAVLETLREVEDKIRWRLVMGLEPLPAGLRRAPYVIRDGRVVFTVPRMWEASFAYGGDGEDGADGEWFLLGVRFLFRVKDARGVWSSTPLGPLKDHLIDLCNRELLRRPLLPAPPPPVDPNAPPPPPAVGEETPAPAPSGEANEKVRAGTVAVEDAELAYKADLATALQKRKRDRPLFRAYSFLHRLALSYQLEAVHAQAARLRATGWGGGKEGEGGLRVERRGEEVRVEYWSHEPEPLPPSSKPSTTPRPRTSGGTLIFSLRPPSVPSAAAPTASSKTPRTALPPPAQSAAARPRERTKAREEALRAALERGSWSYSPPPPSTSHASSAAPAPSATPAPRASITPAPPAAPTTSDERAQDDEPDLPPSLLVSWLPSSSSPLSSSSPTSLSDLPLSLDTDLDLERLLRRVTRRQAAGVVEAMGRVVGEKLAGEEGRAGVEARVVYPSSASSQRREVGKGKEREGVEGADDAEEGEENEEEEDDAVPYLHFTLLGTPHSLGAFIDPPSGRFELRPVPALSSSSRSSSTSSSAAAAAAATDEGESTPAREQRLRLASERVEKERRAAAVAMAVAAEKAAADEGAAASGKGGKGAKGAAVSAAKEVDAEGWMRSVGEVVARIRAQTILDDLDTLLALLSLPSPVRRLALPPRELAKFGPAFASSTGRGSVGLQTGRAGFVFVPLAREGGEREGEGRSGLEGCWLALVVVEAEQGEGEGIRPALLRTREATDGATTWMEIVEVGWIALPSFSPSSSSAGAPSAATASSTTHLPFTPRADALLALFRYAVHRATLLRLSEGLAARRIAFRLQTPADGGGGRPYLVVPSRGLVRTLGAVGGKGKGKEKEREVASPNVAVQAVVDEEGRVKVTLHARFLFPPSPSSSSSSSETYGRPKPEDLPPNVLYSPTSGVVVFAVEGDVGTAVERLLRAYASVARTVAAAQQAYRQLPPPASSSSSAPSTSASAASPTKPSKPLKPAPANGASTATPPVKVVNGVGVMPFVSG